MNTSRKLRLQMKPDIICREYRQAKDPVMQIKILAELNGCEEKDIRDILIDFGTLEGSVTEDYSRNLIYVEGKLLYPQDPKPKEDSGIETHVRMTPELKEIIRNDLQKGLDPSAISQARRTSKTNVYRIRKELEAQSGQVIDQKAIQEEAERQREMEHLHKEAKSLGFVSSTERQSGDRWNEEVLHCMKTLEGFFNQVRTSHPSHETKECLKATAKSMIGDVFDHVPEHLLRRKESE